MARFWKNLFLRLPLIKKWLPYASFGVSAVFFDPALFAVFGEWGWRLFVLVMIIRPLADLFSKSAFLRFLLALRQELAIIGGWFIFAHVIGFFWANELSFWSALGDPFYWNLRTLFGWGMTGFLLLIPLLFTSNCFSMRFLGKHWKRLQYLSYLFFVCGGVHLYYASGETNSLVALGVWLGLLSAAALKKRGLLRRGVTIALFLGLGQVFGGCDNAGTAERSVPAETDVIRTSATKAPMNTIVNTTKVEQKLAIGDRCIGCGKCVALDHEHFAFDNTARKAKVISQENLRSAALTRAIQHCPVAVIGVGG